mmetsp:Transcript_28196/g.43677  ORF Transcript_28196/g.43677 Transcript_28196/m.43677 type:complete len:346 (-) Transcript_28196:35-1072(-)
MRLTSLGYYLDPLPLEPSVGKMVLIGIALGCLDLALTIAASLSVSPFDSSFDARDGVKINKDLLSRKCRSDQLASVNAYNIWVSIRKSDKAKADAFVQESNLSMRKLEEMSLIKHQLHSVLLSQKFITDISSESKKEFFTDTSVHSTLSNEVGLAKALLSCALYPNVAVRSPRCYRTKSGDSMIDSSSVLGTVEMKNAAEEYSHFYMFQSALKQNPVPHGSQNGVMYRLSEVTNVPLWSLLLLGAPSGSMEYLEELNMLVVDQWIFAIMDRATYDLLKLLKLSLLFTLNEKLANSECNKARDALRVVQRCIIRVLRAATKIEHSDEEGIIAAPVVREATSMGCKF